MATAEISAHPRLLLHFDVNGTLILKDTSKQASSEHMLISALAESIFDEWDQTHGRLSFKQYVYQVLLPGDKSDRILKNARQKVVSTFFQWMQENKHPALERVKSVYERVKARFTEQATGRINFTVFSSFYVMLDKLRQQQIPFTVILRTFGNDLPEVAQEIESHPSGIKFSQWGNFEGTQLQLDGRGTIAKVDAIFDAFLKSEGHLAIKDDWGRWNQDGELGRSGKPFICDTDANRHGVKNLSLFFDDNITCEEKDIFKPMNLSGQPLDSRALQGSLAFPVDTIEAILDDNYFYNRVVCALMKTNHGLLSRL